MPDIYPIPASRIKGLRVVCRKCGVEVMLPVTAREVLAQCFNCGTRFADGDGVAAALRELKWLHDTDARGDSGISFWVDPAPQ